MEINKIYQMDCLEGLKQMEEGSVDMTVTSPPYDDLRNYNGFNIDMDGILAELFRVTKVGGIVVWVVGDATVKGSESGSSFKQAIKAMEVGFRLHDTMIYEKNTSSFPARRNGNRYTQIFEYMFIFSKGKPKTSNLICDKPNKWAGHTNWGEQTRRNKEGQFVTTDIKPVPDFSPRNNIWRYVVGGGFASTDKIAYKHPAIFPEKLAEDHILSWSNPGDVVLDPFMGSGTTAKMASKNGRNFIGFEISEEYVQIANERLDKLQQQLNLI